jgi:hypothetical protein
MTSASGLEADGGAAGRAAEAPLLLVVALGHETVRREAAIAGHAAREERAKGQPDAHVQVHLVVRVDTHPSTCAAPCSSPRHVPVST